MTDVKLGNALDAPHGDVCIPIRHMVVAGQTQEAGKTTTLEGLIARSGKTAIAFVTKRGEQSFSTGRRIEPYFRERADWQFVASILEATMREKMKFERSWIINASKGARTLADVHRNVKKALQTARGISEGVYTTLDAYLEIVVPRIAQVKFAKSLHLAPGLNVLDLSDRDSFPSELQALVMRSVLEWVYERCEDTITILPEAWEFIPQSRGSPVKLAAVELIRKGAGLRNYVWLDSQDIGGVDKEILRSCPVWLLGVQREQNEIKRTLANIPEGLAKPKPAAIATLEKGQFFACFGRHAIKTYVQPAWLDDAGARLVARGQIPASELRPPKTAQVSIRINAKIQPETVRALDELVHHAQLNFRDPIDFPEPEDEFMSAEAMQKLDQIVGLLEQLLGAAPAVRSEATAAAVNVPIGTPDEEALYQRFKARLTKEAPGLIKLLVSRPEIEVREERVTVEMDTKTVKGMMAKLLSEGFFDQTINGNAAWKETQRRWDNRGNSNRVYEQLDWLTSNGFLTKESDGYKAVSGMKVNVVKG